MKKKIISGLLVFGFLAPSLSAESGYIASYTNRDKKTKVDDLFVEQGYKNESVFDDIKLVEPLKNNDVEENIQTNVTKLNVLLECAFDMIGTKYGFGAKGGSSKTDCSLYTQNVFKKVGIDLPRSSAEQSTLGKKVSKDNLKVGDLLFFRTYKKAPSHVGIYIGDGKMIHASFRQGQVQVDDLDKIYYTKRFLFAKRFEL